MAKRVLFYLNQFFGGIGGEDKADYEPAYREDVIGPDAAIVGGCGELIEPVGTVICGDNFFGEREDEAKAFIARVIDEQKPDIFVAGPAFNAGRYGFACAGACKVAHDMGVLCVSGMYEENPGLEHCQSIAWVAETANSAAKMRKALPIMTNLVKKVANGEELEPEADKYFAQGRRECIIVDEIGADRAISMLLARLNETEFATELPMAEFDEVDPAPAIKDLSKATIAIVSSSGVVPEGNPDRLQSASAQQWNKYFIGDRDDLPAGDYYTVHGGYDPMYINEQPTRGVPLDIMRELEKEGKIGKVYDYYYITTGTGTAVANAKKFGTEIGAELKNAGIDGVILTST
jgi:betaine reductase